MSTAEAKDASWLLVFGWLLILLLIALATTVAWLLYGWVSSVLEQTDPAVLTAVLGGSFTVIASVAAVVLSQRSIKKRQIEDAHREFKSELYSEFIEKIAEMIRTKGAALPDKGSDAELPEELMQYFYSFHSKLILWGSPGVIKSYLHFRNMTVNPKKSQQPCDIVLAVDGIYRCMRKDLGASIRLPKGALLKLYMKDDDPLMPASVKDI